MRPETPHSPRDRSRGAFHKTGAFHNTWRFTIQGRFTIQRRFAYSGVSQSIRAYFHSQEYVRLKARADHAESLRPFRGQVIPLQTAAGTSAPNPPGGGATRIAGIRTQDSPFAWTIWIRRPFVFMEVSTPF